jgi:hypothetical protein
MGIHLIALKDFTPCASTETEIDGAPPCDRLYALLCSAGVAFLVAIFVREAVPWVSSASPSTVAMGTPRAAVR